MTKLLILTGSGGYLGSKLSNKILGLNDIKLINVTSNKSLTNKDTYNVNFKRSNSIIQFFKKIRKCYGEPDVLINNAAINTEKKFSDFIINSSDKRILETYLVNSFGSLLFIKYFLKKKPNNNDKKKIVINLLTRNVIIGGNRHVDYISSKAALYNATRTLANDYKNVTFFNLLCGPFGYEKSLSNPDLITNEIVKLIFLKTSCNYKDLYFESNLNFIQFIIKNIYNYLKNIKNV